MSVACAALLRVDGQSGDASLLHGVLKLALRLAFQWQPGSKLSAQEYMIEQMQLVFALLANVVLCRECLSSLWKVLLDRVSVLDRTFLISCVRVIW